jgi:hypothetical protein
MQGRITARHLPLAEKHFPGIRRLYAEMTEKPATFLQLLWAYEGMIAAPKRTRRAGRTRRV